MKKVKVETVVLTIASGEIDITAQQAKPRAHRLEPVKVDKAGNGVYLVKEPVQFKRGEVLGYDGHVGKDGIARDPDAEELAKIESEEKEEERRKAAVARAVAEVSAKLRAEFEAGIGEEVEKGRAELEAALRQEIQSDLVKQGWTPPNGAK